MPYHTIGDLPDSVQHSLPKHAQEIYQEAFNSAWDHYQDPRDRRSDDDRESVAHKVAWSAVKQKYTKVEEGYWKAKAH